MSDHTFSVTVVGELKVYNFAIGRILTVSGLCEVQRLIQKTRVVYRFLPNISREGETFWRENVVGIGEAFWLACCQPNLKDGVLDAAAVEATDKGRRS